MKKTLTVGTAFILTFSTISVADDFSGHRVGLGYAKSDAVFDGQSVDWGKGFKLEYGYDVNRILGVNTSYSRTSDEQDFFDIASSKVKSNTLKIDADIGYTFDLDGARVKPYGAIGLGWNKDQIKEHINGQEIFNNTYKDSSLYLGAGVRASLDMGLYADIRFDFPTYDDVDTDQFSFSVGYKF